MIGGRPKILIIRLSAIGDVVRVLPAANAIRDACPGAQIDWIVEPAAADLLFDHPALDRIWTFRRSPHWFQSAVRFVELRQRVRDEHYDIAIDFHGIFKSGLLLQATRAERRIGFAPPRAREGSHRFANELVDLPEAILNRVKESAALAELVTQKTSTIAKFGIVEQINADVFQHVTAHRSGRPWLALVHAPVERAEKRWPTERFAALVDGLLDDGRFDVAMSYGPGQEQMLVPILNRCKRKPILPPPCKSLREYAGLVSLASIYVGVDTGPMHIAAAVGTPVVAIFGGTDPRMHAPVGSPSICLGGVPVTTRTDRASLEASLAALRSVEPADVVQSCVALLQAPSEGG